jgi:selenide,water dikinase
MGFMPAGAFKNKEFRMGMVEFLPSVDPILQDVLFDPQTSGGLLICVHRDHAEELLADLIRKGIKDAAIIGEVIDKPKEKILVK